MTVGITGATGFLGANLLKYLHERTPGQDRIIPFCSRRPRNPLTEALRLRYEHLDVTSREEVFRKTKGIEVLYHLAGAVDYSRRGRLRTWDVNVLGTRNVLDAAVENRIGTLVYASSISVLGVPDGEKLMANEENHRYAPGRNPISFEDSEAALGAVEASVHGDYDFAARMRVPYFDSKLAAFELAMRRGSAREQRVVVVLPGTAVGEGDVGYAIGGLVDRVYRNRLFFTLPGGSSFVSACDVARGMHLAFLRGRPGQAYIITGRPEDNMSYRDFMKLVARVAREAFGRRCFGGFLTVPSSAARVLSMAAEALFPRTRLPQGLALSGSLTHRFDCRKAKEELGYRPCVPLEESIRRCIEFTVRTRRGAQP